MFEAFSVLSFSPIKGGVRPDNPMPSSSAEAAIGTAERKATTTAGAITVCSMMNGKGEVTGTEVLAVFGDLPDYIIESLTG